MEDGCRQFALFGEKNDSLHPLISGCACQTGFADILILFTVVKETLCIQSL